MTSWGSERSAGEMLGDDFGSRVVEHALGGYVKELDDALRRAASRRTSIVRTA